LASRIQLNFSGKFNASGKNPRDIPEMEICSNSVVGNLRPTMNNRSNQTFSAGKAGIG